MLLASLRLATPHLGAELSAFCKNSAFYLITYMRMLGKTLVQVGGVFPLQALHISIIGVLRLNATVRG